MKHKQILCVNFPHNQMLMLSILEVIEAKEDT